MSLDNTKALVLVNQNCQSIANKTSSATQAEVMDINVTFCILKKSSIFSDYESMMSC